MNILNKYKETNHDFWSKLCVILGDKCINIYNINASNFTLYRENTSIFNGGINKRKSIVNFVRKLLNRMIYFKKNIEPYVAQPTLVIYSNVPYAIPFY
jgi:hypothetical protein